MENLHTIKRNDINELPKTAGVYLFYGSAGSPRMKKKEIIYIGKAINIKERVKNHFLQPTYKDNFFVEKATHIGFIETGSEIEALVLEASLIKKYLPKFNQVWRDDKNYFYVAVGNYRGTTRNLTQNYAEKKLPYVFITHQPRKSNVKGQLSNVVYIGPFTEGNALKKTLKYLRKVFPYYTTNKHPKNKCTWCHLGLCPGPLLRHLSAWDAQAEGSEGQANPDLLEYKKNIKKLTLILEGKRKTALHTLRKEMEAFSKQNKFEEALEIRNKISVLEPVIAHSNVLSQPVLEGPTLQIFGGSDPHWLKTQKLLQGILDVKNPPDDKHRVPSVHHRAISKIECYDISNIQGTQAVGSMVVFVNGRPDRSQYKKFRIKMENKPNDIAMLKEVLTRRLLHPEWGYPEVMLIDGGIGQLNVAIRTKNQDTITKQIKVISIAKGKRELLIEDSASTSTIAKARSDKKATAGKAKKIPLKNLPQDIYNLIVHLDDEAHRFAITYHKKLRQKYLLDKNS